MKNLIEPILQLPTSKEQCLESDSRQFWGRDSTKVDNYERPETRHDSNLEFQEPIWTERVLCFIQTREFLQIVRHTDRMDDFKIAIHDQRWTPADKNLIHTAQPCFLTLPELVISKFNRFWPLDRTKQPHRVSDSVLPDSKNPSQEHLFGTSEFCGKSACKTQMENRVCSPKFQIARLEKCRTIRFDVGTGSTIWDWKRAVGRPETQHKVLELSGWLVNQFGDSGRESV